MLSSYLGSVIEYYDFLLYPPRPVLIDKIFFSNLDRSQAPWRPRRQS